jgi:hypothetical protein
MYGENGAAHREKQKQTKVGSHRVVRRGVKMLRRRGATGAACLTGGFPAGKGGEDECTAREMTAQRWGTGPDEKPNIDSAS